MAGFFDGEVIEKREETSEGVHVDDGFRRPTGLH
jgi:hypothetical protein